MFSFKRIFGFLKRGKPVAGSLPADQLKPAFTPFSKKKPAAKPQEEELTLEQAKKIVLKRYPRATATQFQSRWNIRNDDGAFLSSSCPNELRAWNLAAERIRSKKAIQP